MQSQRIAADASCILNPIWCVVWHAFNLRWASYARKWGNLFKRRNIAPVKFVFVEQAVALIILRELLHLSREKYSCLLFMLGFSPLTTCRPTMFWNEWKINFLFLVSEIWSLQLCRYTLKIIPSQKIRNVLKRIFELMTIFFVIFSFWDIVPIIK